MKNYSPEKAARDNPSYTEHEDTPTVYKNGKSTDTVPDNEGQEKKEKLKEEETEEEEEAEDPWNVQSLKQDYVPWSELTDKQKATRCVLYPVRVVLVLGFLYLFICSLDFLSSAFKLLGGKKAGEVFQQSDILTNPVAGLMMGVLVTVLVQSSSTSTSIVISMVGAGILTAKTAVPIVMGANIGTSVTNTIVAMGQITDKNDFRRAFAGATVHDMFNWLSVIVLLPIEVATGYLFRLSDAIVNSMHLNETLDVNQDLLKTITKPFTTLIIQVSSTAIREIATGEVEAEDATLMKFCCDKVTPAKCCGKTLTKDLGMSEIRQYDNTTRVAACQMVDQCVYEDYEVNQKGLDACMSAWESKNITATYNTLNTLNCTTLADSMTEQDCCSNELTRTSFFGDMARNATSVEQTTLCSTVNSTCFGSDVYRSCMSAWSYGRQVVRQSDMFNCTTWTVTIGQTCNKPCKFLFRDAHVEQGGDLTDEAVGAILLVLSLVLLCICLICIVKLLHSLLQGPMAKLIKKFVNADFPGFCGYFTGYLAILVGAGMTILVQSSSIFTSTLTPLVGMGVITLERVYPLTLGSNIGTTATGILAALAQDVNTIPRSLQVAMCHLFFNISGIAIFYPLPFFRPPIPAAKFLGNTTAKYRWFAIVYLIIMFFLLPLMVFALSIPGWYVLAIVLGPVVLVVLVVGIIKCLQAKRPKCLPGKLQSWKFLPLPLRSLEPYDRVMKKLCFCKRFQDEPPKRGEDVSKKGETNEGFDGVVVDTTM